MKRGLVIRDPDEISDDEWTARCADLQAWMASEGVDLLLVYGDVFRSDDIGYLTNLCIYWNEGVVAIGPDGAPVFLTKLSPRVHTWMRRISVVDDLRSGKDFGQLVAGLIADREPGVLGLVDAELWPASVVKNVSESAGGWEVRGLGSIVRDKRRVPSPAELVLLRRGAELLNAAAKAAADPALHDGERIAVLEQQLRGEGFTDVYIDPAHGRDGIVGLQAVGEYRHGWLQASRLVGDPAGRSWAEPLRAALDAAIAVCRAGADVPTLLAAAASELDDAPAGSTWDLRCVNQADLSSNGEFHRADPQLTAGEVVVVSLEMFVEGARAEVAETVLVRATGVEVLTSSDHAVSESSEEALTA